MSATVARRLERLEAVRRADDQLRHNTAVRELGRTMAPEHIRFVQDWIRERFGRLDVRFALPGESPYATLMRLRPPALVRATWLMLDNHVRCGGPVYLSPVVAEVYLTDPDAWPTNPCEECGYLLPTRSRVRPDGTYRHIAWYMGECPVCGLDNHPKESEDT